MRALGTAGPTPSDAPPVYTPAPNNAPTQTTPAQAVTAPPATSPVTVVLVQNANVELIINSTGPITVAQADRK